MLNEKELEKIGEFIIADNKYVYDFHVEDNELVLRIDGAYSFMYLQEPLSEYIGGESNFLIKGTPFIFVQATNCNTTIYTITLREYNEDNEEELFIKHLEEELNYEMTIRQLERHLTEMLEESEFIFDEENIEDESVCWNNYLIDYKILEKNDNISEYVIKVTSISNI